MPSAVALGAGHFSASSPPCIYGGRRACGVGREARPWHVVSRQQRLWWLIKARIAAERFRKEGGACVRRGADPCYMRNLRARCGHGKGGQPAGARRTWMR